MNAALNKLAEEAKLLGYRNDAILRDYTFSDFNSFEAGSVRRASLAVFTQTPPSYRSAAFGAALQGARGPEATVREHTSLGAPLFFVISGDEVTVWQVYAGGPPRLLECASFEELGSLFATKKDLWSPEVIHRAKSIGRVQPAYQLDFVDAGLMPAIEGQIHEKLDRLLAETLSATGARSNPGSAKAIFQGVFRLLAAKILADRGHEAASGWDPDRVSSILSSIGNYYHLPGDFYISGLERELQNAWGVLSNSINVSNISADDLAFVYENTLVTPETRQSFGTHSTPRHVAEYVVGRLGLWQGGANPLSVYEPFAGAGVFLVSALRHMREALPYSWDDQRRHELLVSKISGSEIDVFACEVATLSLILADYPNRNGWKIENANLFDRDILTNRLAAADVILCNPPFEAFTSKQRERYPEVSAISGAKAEAVLMLALQSQPKALGFVLPQAFLMDRAYREHRKLIEKRFREVELVSLPDGIFAVSQVESALLIARDPIMSDGQQIVRSSEVDDQDRRDFKLTGLPSRTREEQRSTSVSAEGQLWIPPLGPLWRRLKGCSTLGELFEGHWGIRWLDKRQGTAASDRSGPNKALGLLRAHDHRQFALGRESWLDVDPEHLYGGGQLPWTKPKILCNAGRLSRGPWRLAAAVDRTGLVASQQFVGLWPLPEAQAADLDAYAAILNSPIANAFLDDHSTDRRLRITTLLSMPLPSKLPLKLGELARTYATEVKLREKNLLFSSMLEELLDEIDAVVMEAYDLPPRMIRSLLSAFKSNPRPLVHEWQPWGVSDADPALTLRELRSTQVNLAKRDWLREELTPVSKREAEQAAAYLP